MARVLVLAFLLVAVLLCATITGVEGAAIRAKANNNNGPSYYKSIAKAISDKIKHIIILMEENRSFDHMFGFYGKGTDGLTGKEYNLVNTGDLSSKKVYVDNKAPFINQCNPSHDTISTMAKIYGNISRAEACNYTCENMGGFIENELLYASNNYCNVMEALDTVNKLPVLTALADNYVLMDRFFSSMPGPTWPNRLFHLSATTAGLTETYPWYQNVLGKLFPQKTILDQVSDVGGEWRVYYNDTPWEMFLETIAHNPQNTRPMTQFFSDCQTGNLPDYAFINPRSGVNLTERVGSNDHHPDHDIRAGEQYYKDIYEALRASPQWNETLFIITYDEHGGFYDHVTPPINVPDPEDGVATYPDAGFTFDRLGIRIPTLLISPWVPKGLVVNRAPEAQRPFANSEYDLTSIMASARKILKKLAGVPPLTKRDAWSSTFEHVLAMVDEPRTDCPMHLPTPEAPSKWDLSVEARQPVNDLQSEIIAMHHTLANPHEATTTHPHHIQQQSQVGEYLRETFETHKKRTLKWKAGKGHLAEHILKREGIEAGSSMLDATGATYTIRIAPFKDGDVFVNAWKVAVDANGTVPWMTIHGMAKPFDGLCLDVASYSVGAPVLLNLCYPSNVPSQNRDEYQQWIVGNDATIRPFHAQHLCVTNNFFQIDPAMSNTVTLAECNVIDVRQHYAYHGKAPGDPGDGVFYYGDGSTVIAAVPN